MMNSVTWTLTSQMNVNVQDNNNNIISTIKFVIMLTYFIIVTGGHPTNPLSDESRIKNVNSVIITP